MIHRHHFLRFLAGLGDIAFIFQFDFSLGRGSGINVKIQSWLQRGNRHVRPPDEFLRTDALAQSWISSRFQG